MLLSLTLLVAVSLSASATSMMKERKRGSNRPNLEKLNLTEDQKLKLSDIDKNYKEKENALHEQRRALHKQKRDEMVSLLTPEQQAAWTKETAKREHRYKGHTHNRGHKSMANLDTTTKAKLDERRAQLDKDVNTVKMTRVAPEEQNRRIRELKQAYRKDKREIIRAAKTDNKIKTVS